jgi:hypothetical protein
MNKYPVLSGMSMIARVVGWIALCLAGLMCLIGLIFMPGFSIAAARTSYASNPFDLYLGICLLTGGGILLVMSLILLMTGEIVRVVIDAQHRLFESARVALQSVHPNPAQTAAASVQRDRQEAQLSISRNAPIQNTIWAQPEDFPALKVVQGIISLARKLGYTVRARDTCVVFSKDGRVEPCYNVAHIRRFARINRLLDQADVTP